MRHNTLIGFAALMLLGLIAAGSFAVVAGYRDSGTSAPVRGDGMPYDINGYSFTHTIGGPLIPTTPVDVAVGADGRVFVADIGLNRVLALTPEGALDTTWANDGMTSRLVFPTGVAVGPDGSLYVLQLGNTEVHVFDPEGQPQRSWQIGGDQELTGLDAPTAIAVDHDGTVYIPDQRAGELRRYEAGGTELDAWPLPLDSGGASEIQPGDVVERDGRILLTYRNASSPGGGVLAFDENGTASDIEDLVPVSAQDVDTRAPGSIAIDASGMVALLYLQDGEQGDAAGAPLIATSSSVWEPHGIARLARINGVIAPGIAFDDSGRILVADPARQRIGIYGRDGAPEGEIRSPEGAGLLAGLDEIAVGPDDRLYIADPLRGQVTAYDRSGAPRTIFTLPPGDEDETTTGFTRLRMRLAVDASGAVYALDETTAQVTRFLPDGEIFSTDWARDSEPDDAIIPLMLGAGPGDRIYVVDAEEQDRLYVFSTEGEDLGILVEPFWEGAIQDIAATADTIYTVELGAGTSAVRAFSPEGDLRGEQTDLSRGDGNANRTGFSVAPDGRGGLLIAAVNVRSGPEFEYQLLRLDADGEIDRLGTLDIPFTTLPDIAVDSKGRLYIAAPNDQRVFVYEREP